MVDNQPGRYGQPEIVFKLVLLGNVGVGKTALFKRFTMGTFDDAPLTADYKKIQIQVQKTTIKILIHDTAGQERFRTLTSSYFRNAHGVLVVYDLSDQSTFDDLESIFYEGSRYCGKALKFLIANKLDLHEKRAVKTEEGKLKSEELGASHFFESSAKTNENVNEILQTIAHELLQRKNHESNPEEEDILVPTMEDLHHENSNNNKKNCC